VCYRPDVGYVQGMSYLAGMLLLNMDTLDAFVALCNMLNRKCHMAFSKGDQKMIECYKNAFQVLFAESLPALSAHLASLGLESDLFLFDWIVTLFTRSLPLEVTSRIWDMYCLQGELALFRAALAVLHAIERRLLGQPFDVIIHTLTHPLTLSEPEFIQHLAAVVLPEKKLQAVLAKYVPKA